MTHQVGNLAKTAGVLLSSTTNPQTHERDALRAGAVHLLLLGVDQMDHPLVRTVDSTSLVFRPPRQAVPLVIVCCKSPGPSVWEAAVALKAERVITLPEDDAWLVERLVEAATPGDPSPVIGVLGACGGAGGTIFSAALASVATGRGLRTVLADVDPWGGGIDLAFGAREIAGLRWPDLLSARGRLSPHLLARSLPIVDGVSLVSWDGSTDPGLTGEAVSAVLDAARRDYDLVIVDLGSRVWKSPLEAARVCTLVLLLTPAEIRAGARAAHSAAVLHDNAIGPHLVVRRENRKSFSGADLAAVLDLPLMGELRSEPALARCFDAGLPAALSKHSSAVRLSHRILAEVVSR